MNRGHLPGTTGGVTRGAILVAILLVAAGLRLYGFRGYWGTDDGEYALLANSVAQGTYDEFVQENYVRHFNAPAHLPYRVALIAPLALLFRTFGVNEATLAAYPLLISLLGVLLAYASGRLLFGVNAGLIAGALWAVVPGDYDIATLFLPDGVASFYASLAVLTVLALRSAAQPRTWSLFAGGLLAGSLFGISWLSKESVVYLVPFCAALIAMDVRRDFRNTLALWAGVALASGGMLLAEMAFYQITRGDFMLRMHENERSFIQTRAYLFYEGSRFGWPVGGDHLRALIKRLCLDGPSVIFLNAQFLYLPLMGLVGAARAWFWKDRSFLVPALWLGTLAFMYNFMTCSFASYTPLVLLDRYLHPIILPAAVLTAGLVVRLMEQTAGAASEPARGERLFWGAIVVATLVLVSGHTVFREIRDLERVQPMYQVGALARLVRPDDTVYTDPLSRKALEFHWQYPAKTAIVDFEGMNRGEIRPGSFVLVDKNRLNWLDVNVSMWLTEDYGYHEPEFSQSPPEAWKVVWRNRYATLFRVN
jgi:4-amino-4-deoxy-L-arabinose transferase-like glycosyltransferase